MKIAVISPKGCSGSARRLAEALGAHYENPYVSGRTNFMEFDGVFNYGISDTSIRYKNILNKPSAIKVCVDKVLTFKHLKAYKIPIPASVTHHKLVPPDWETVVCRTTSTGRGNEGMSYVYQVDGEAMPPGVLFTEYFIHEWEYRIVVFRGVVVGRYKKVTVKDDTKPDGEGWELHLMLPDGFEPVDKACVDAAAALDMDYVGFDVVENKKGEFVLLEANSGPILHDEVLEYIVKAFKG